MTASRSRNGFVDVVPAAATIGGLAALVLVLVVAGPGYWAVEFAFGSEYAVTRCEMVRLAASSVGLMVVLSLAHGLNASRSRGLRTLGGFNLAGRWSTSLPRIAHPPASAWFGHLGMALVSYGVYLLPQRA